MDDLLTDFILFGGDGWIYSLFDDLSESEKITRGKNSFFPWECSTSIRKICSFSWLVRSDVKNKPFVINTLVINRIITRIKKLYPNGGVCLFNRTNSFAHDVYFLKKARLLLTNFKFVYWFTDTVGSVCKTTPEILDICNEYYDLIVTYDPYDAQRYGFTYLETPYSYKQYGTGGGEDGNYLQKDIDLLYVGKAKIDIDDTRYKKIIAIFAEAQKAGLKTEFHIMDVPKEKQLYNEKIRYNQYLPYEEVIKLVKRSKCIVEVSQGEETGTTLRLFEAIVFSTNLLFTNKNIINHPYYLPDRMKYIDLSVPGTISIDFGFVNNIIGRNEEAIRKLSPASFLNSIFTILTQEKENEK